MPRRSRLVASTTTSGHDTSTERTRSAVAPRTCSQLSSTRRRRPARNRSWTTSCEGVLGPLDHSQRRGHRMEHEIGAHRHQVHEHAAAGEEPGVVRRGHDGQAGLPDPAGPDQRHQPVR